MNASNGHEMDAHVRLKMNLSEESDTRNYPDLINIACNFVATAD
jgi:hypothetical protein